MSSQQQDGLFESFHQADTLGGIAATGEWIPPRLEARRALAQYCSRA
jgi:hypothetical protein